MCIDVVDISWIQTGPIRIIIINDHKLGSFSDMSVRHRISFVWSDFRSISVICNLHLLQPVGIVQVLFNIGKLLFIVLRIHLKRCLNIPHVMIENYTIS
jgi:predicted transcriptional regulator